jgi:DNA-binding transcriptional ArsR family regulator
MIGCEMKQEDYKRQVDIHWDWGTGYDLFFSLFVLHKPDEFSLRGAWAAGVRSRLSIQDRKTLEEAQEVIPFPLSWLFHLPTPTDGNALIQALSSIASKDRVCTLTFSTSWSKRARQIFDWVSSSGKWREEERRVLSEESKHSRHKFNPELVLNWWSQAEEYGERYLQALRSYHEVFFAEEERRIEPFLIDALNSGKKRAAEVSWQVLIEELSQGVRFDSLNDLSELVLVPSYWSTPLIVYDRIDDQGVYLFLFGARPSDFSLMPGEVVPDALLRALKALADPTRLRILRHLSESALTPSQLARLLRLRAPTVTHHLNALRLAGLVRLTLEKEGEKRYEARPETVKGTFSAIQKFMDAGEKG